MGRYFDHSIKEAVVFLRPSIGHVMMIQKMRLQILSDLHLEFGPYELEPAKADVVILAGDIHVGGDGIEWMHRQFPGRPVIYVLGNHEFYHHSIFKLTETLKRETSGSPIHLLENEAVEIDGVTFLGCTLWTDFRMSRDQDAAMLVADQGMSDYHLIKGKSGKWLFRPWESVKLFEESVGWLKTELSRHDPARTVIVTHHAPSPHSIEPFRVGDALNAAFVSDLDDFIKESGVPLWIHGHTHYNVDYKIGATRIYSNQRGYPQTVADGFKPGAVVKV
jgi:Icc-related predicted phosphoesterase